MLNTFLTTHETDKRPYVEKMVREDYFKWEFGILTTLSRYMANCNSTPVTDLNLRLGPKLYKHI